jgi:hypothetical protein
MTYELEAIVRGTDGRERVWVRVVAASEMAALREVQAMPGYTRITDFRTVPSATR